MNKQEYISFLQSDLRRNGCWDLSPDPEGITLIEVQTKGGEGQGDHYHVVYEVKGLKGSENILLKADAHYTSYDGVNWDYTEVYEVKPVEKTITVYEKI